MENKLEKKIELSQMKTLAYFLISNFKKWIIDGTYQEQLSQLNYIDYHNFSKTRLPFGWYENLLELMDLSTNDVLVEIAKVSSNHNDELHYHKISHAFCVILGPQQGFNDCYYGEIIKDKEVIRTNEGLEIYFPSFCKHTFNAPYSETTGPLYFLSIQSPPLLTKERDDFYFVNKNA